ncbi:MAG: DNA polymerase I [Deltaproteobacteria bacterium]|nr:MAG: DNA polymerase I [Deltaproteobacteria bacterium]
MSPKPRLFLIDASSYIYRAFFALPHLSNSKGLPTNAVYGFTQMLLKVIKDHQPTHLALIFDSKAPSFRKKIYQDYKANRAAMPDELQVQIPLIKRVIEGFNLKMVEKEGYEADDIIGTISRDADTKGVETVIVTGDKDMMQLVSDKVTLLDTMKDRVTGPEQVKERFGVEPGRVVEVLGLAGDSSDNVPGVPGIGEKSAVKLIQEFQGLDHLLKSLDKVGKAKLRENLVSFAEQARLSKDLVTIDCRVPLEYDLEEFRFSVPDEEKLQSVFKELEFTKLVREFASRRRLPSDDYHLVLTEEELRKLVDDLQKVNGFALDLETTARDPMRAELVGLSFSFREHQAFYLPVTHDYPGCPQQLKRDYVLGLLKPVLETDKIEKYGQNIKYDYLVLCHYGIRLAGVSSDTMVASYLLNPSRPNHNLEQLSQEWLDHKLISFKDVTGSGKNSRCFSEVELKQARDYSCEDADVTFLLTQKLLPRLREEGLEDLFRKVEIPLIEVLAEMERNGVKINQESLREMSREFSQQLEGLIEEIYQLAGVEFNVDSPRQLREVLFERLQLPPGKKTKTGYSTDVDVLTKLAKDHELPAVILEYRNLAKLKNTYIDTLPELINPKTGRIHASFNQTVTATGRLSSSEPNLQNIPVRTEEGRKIRRAFIPEKGNKLLCADYSQIELRVLAHISGDEVLLRAFRKDEDIHNLTASEVFGCLPGMATGEMRRQAKVINFGIIYGMSAYGLAKELGISPGEASKYIENYFGRYQGVKAYIDQTLKDAKQKGYVTTLRGRRRWLPDIRSENATVRQFAERTAINTPIQGTAADLIKVAMINISRCLARGRLKTKMIIQVHDELVFEVPDKELRKVSEIIREEMEGAMELKVPLKVDIGWGESWEEAH